MKFIRTVDGGWLSVEHIAVFRPNTLSEPKPGEQREVRISSAVSRLARLGATEVLDELLTEAEPSLARRQR